MYMRKLKIQLKEDQMAWFSSDWHLGHKNILKFDGRPYDTITEHDDSLIVNFKSCVRKNDIAFLIGDLTLYSNPTYLDKVCKHLSEQCKIYYVQGNHDHSKELKVMSRYFEMLSPMQEIYINDQMITLCHYGMQVWNKSHRGSWHLHGHSHGSLKDIGGKRLDVAVNMHGYEPISFGKVKEYMDKRGTINQDHHVEEFNG